MAMDIRPAPPATNHDIDEQQRLRRVIPGPLSASDEDRIRLDVTGGPVPRPAPPVFTVPIHPRTAASFHVVTPATWYRPVEDLCIITCYFNSEHYHSKRLNYDRFRQSIVNSGIGLLTVECAFGSERFELSHEPGVIRVRNQDVMWHKENLLNLAMTHVPLHFTKIAWIDGDILFENPDWAYETSSLLDRYVIVQPFSEAFRLPPGTECYSGIGMRFDGFAAVHSVTPSMAASGNYIQHGHTGFGWAVRRDVLAQLYLYDAAILGGADDLMAHAFCGNFGSKCLDDAFLGNDAARKHFNKWAETAWRLVQGQLAFVPGAALHLWHGEERNRGYGERRVALAQFQFDPVRDLLRDSHGLFHWREPTSPLAVWAGTYFARRREDSE